MSFNSVIPAKAGIHWTLSFIPIFKWMAVPRNSTLSFVFCARFPAFAGMTKDIEFYSVKYLAKCSAKCLQINYLAIFFSLLFISQLAFAELAEIPDLSTRVTDSTGTLSSAEQAQLEQKLAAFEEKKGSQIAVLVVPSTQPEDIAQYSIRVAEKWKIGREKVDDGLLILIAKNDRKMRIEVGYGLEGAVPDLYAKRIISEVIGPKFKQGDFYGGLDAGVDSLIGLVNGEQLPAPQQQIGNNLADIGFGPLFFLVFFAAMFFNAIFGRFFGATATGGASGLVATLFAGTGTGIFVGIGAFIFALLVPWLFGGGGGSSRSSRGDGGYYGGRSSGGSSWGGGGGDFGGGGASGDW